MARTRTTPYQPQLTKLLNNADDLTTFSAASLEDRFDHPPHQARGTNIGRIHKALRMEFAEGKIITFVDDTGRVLREPEIVVPGSKAIGQPQIFARPGVEAPIMSTTRSPIKRRYGGASSSTPASKSCRLPTITLP